MRGIMRLGGAVAAVGLAAGLTAAGPGTASATAGCPAWDGTPPPNPGGQEVHHDLRSVAVAGPCDVWMVGSDSGNGQARIVHWTGGPSWTAVPSNSPADGSDLSSVSAVSPADIWAVGDHGSGSGFSGLALHWDGSAWTQVPIPASAVFLNAVAAVSGRDVWAAGEAGPDAYLAHYDGTSWTRQPLPALTPAPGPGEQQFAAVNALAAVSADDVWAAGLVVNRADTAGAAPPAGPLAAGGRTVAAAASAGGAEVAGLLLHWDGTAWSQVPAPVGSLAIDSVSASGPADVWATAYDTTDHSRTITLHWDGHSWATVPAPSAGILSSVAAISPSSAVAVGWSQDSTGPTQPHVLRWDGRSWTQVPTPGAAPGTFLSAVAAGPAGIWAAGDLNDTQTAALVLGTVPNVTGDTQAAATGAMDSAGLYTTITRVTTATGGCGPAANGTIIATTPPAGTFTGPPVTMTLCDFPPVVTVPAVTGLDDSQAQGTLANAGLTTGTITLSGNCDFPPGTVIRQNPAAGTSLNRGSAVNLTEATPPKPHGCAQ